MRTETLVVVFTDIKGYTAATSSQTHQENARMLRRVERLVAPVVRSFTGRVVKSIGDAYMIVFRSPTQAVQCAAAIQDRLHQHNASTSAEQAIHIRVAMNIGEVRVEKGDVFGEPVNIAARIEQVTPADEIYMSEAVYLTMNRTDLPTEVVGEYELKGIPEPVTVYLVRKFAHLELESDETEVVSSSKVTGLPFGGTQLEHWRRMRWVRRAYTAMWALAMLGVVGAGYLRYRPKTDYSGLVDGVGAKVKEGKPIDALALAGEIPESAVEERALVRRYRRDAVAILLDEGKVEPAEAELDALLHEDGRDAEALTLKAFLLASKGDAGVASMELFTEALKLHPSLGQRPDVIKGVVKGYTYPAARATADAIVETQLKDAAVPALLALLEDENVDRLARHWAAERLKKLGAAEEVDWIDLAIQDLKSTTCKVRKAAIERLGGEGDERAIGPLMRLAEKRSCGAQQARSAAKAILAR